MTKAVIMNKAKISISMKEESLAFISQYQSEYAVSNRSEVIEKAIELLMQEALGREYREANKELHLYSDFDNCVADGLEDEAW